MAGQSKRGLSASKSPLRGMKRGKAASARLKGVATKSPPSPQISGEKAVRKTGASLAMKPLKTSREARRPTDGRAIDRRRQVFDDPAPKR